jgi:hypothetical protein
VLATQIKGLQKNQRSKTRLKMAKKRQKNGKKMAKKWLKKAGG